MKRIVALILLPLCLGVAQANAQDKYAVLIGVETYDEFTRLDYAEEDAVELGKAFQNLGFSTKVMTSRADKSYLRPSTPEKILKVLETQIKSCGNGDTLVVCLSGHGLQFPDEALLESGIRESYFCPEDARKDDKSTLIPINQKIIKMLNDCAATRKLLLVDACRDEVLSEDAKKKGGRRIELKPVYESRRSVPGGMSVLFSCSNRQFSWEHKPLGHSVFSNFAIKYLRGEAGSRYYENDAMDLDNLVSYVRKNTNDYVFKNNLSADGQSPVLRGSSANWRLGQFTKNEFTDSIGMKFRLIPAGQFKMGSPKSEKSHDDDEFQHEVEITRSFYIGTFEVTRGQFARFVRDSSYETEAERDVEGGWGWNEDSEKLEGRDPKYNWRSTGFTQTDAHPVVNVTWNDATAFCKWLSKKENETYRLPTEAEWEYACRAGNGDIFHFGNDPELLAQYANVADGTAKAKFDDWTWTITARDGSVFSCPVGNYEPNEFGLYDMHGNVWEWCQDWFDADYYKTSPLRDPTGPAAGSSRVLRGGSWRTGATHCRSASRHRNDPTNRHLNFGFRVVLVR